MAYILVINGDATIQNGTIECEHGVKVQGGCVNFNKVDIVAQGRTLACIGDTEVNIAANCNFITKGNDVTVFVAGEEEKAPVLNVYGKVINEFEGQQYAISGNGTDKTNSVINIFDGALVKSVADSAIYLPNGGTINVNGGVIEGMDGIYQKAGVINVNKGTIIGKANNEYSYYGNGSNCIGNAITVDFCTYPSGDPVLNIKGGELISENKQAVYAYKPVEKKNGSASLNIENEELKALVERCINIEKGNFSPALNEAFEK